MKKLPLLLIGLLCFTALVTYISAKPDKVDRMDFREHLQGTVSERIPRHYGQWMAIKGEIVTGTGTGDLVGSPICFTLLINRRMKADDQKSFIVGTWKFSSPGPCPYSCPTGIENNWISGVLIGSGTTSDKFSGKFVTTAHGHGIYASIRIRGDFVCKFAPLQTYGAPLGYDAWWNGTVLPRGEP